MRRLTRFIERLLLCEFSSTHAVPSDIQFHDWLFQRKAIKCELCGRTYKYFNGKVVTTNPAKERE